MYPDPSVSLIESRPVGFNSSAEMATSTSTTSIKTIPQTSAKGMLTTHQFFPCPRSILCWFRLVDIRRIKRSIERSLLVRYYALRRCWLTISKAVGIEELTVGSHSRRLAVLERSCLAYARIPNSKKAFNPRNVTLKRTKSLWNSDNRCRVYLVENRPFSFETSESCSMGWYLDMVSM